MLGRVTLNTHPHHAIVYYHPNLLLHHTFHVFRERERAFDYVVNMHLDYAFLSINDVEVILHVIRKKVPKHVKYKTSLMQEFSS